MHPADTNMLDTYLLALGLALAIALLAGIALHALCRTVRVRALFGATRGPSEKPRWGGTSIFLAFAVAPFLASAVSPEASHLFTPKIGDFLGFLGACTLVFAIGLFDDWKVTTWKQKLLGQVAAASAVYAAGYRIDSFGLPWGPNVDLWFLGPVVTVLWVLFFTNSINLIDGRDGVAGGVTVFAAVALAQVASHGEHTTVALLLMALTGGVLGFLLFNLPPATAYLGDSGALLLGFVLGSLSIRASTGPTESIFVAVPLVALGFPLLDTALAVVRRAADARHPLVGDLDHIHHRLERAGLGPRGLLATVYVLSGLFSGAAVILHYVDSVVVEAALFLALLALVGVILTTLGYLLSLWNSAAAVRLRHIVGFFSASTPEHSGGSGKQLPR
jgi:UDP-GlcNAc:undecaprenyl-phosphate GlcNAc-1-phosphate transferase